MNRTVVSHTPESTLKQASEMFARYLFRALTVVEMLGVLPYRDALGLRLR